MAFSFIFNMVDAQRSIAQDTIEVIAMTTSLVIGFYLASMLMSWPRVSEALGCSYSIKPTKLVEVCSEEVVISQTAKTDAVDTLPLRPAVPATQEVAVPRPSQLDAARHALLEHYAALGADAGSWHRACQPPDKKDEEEVQTDQSRVEEKRVYRSDAWSQASVARNSLMEQYGVFGASVGSWSQSELALKAEDAEAVHVDVEKGEQLPPCSADVELYRSSAARHAILEHYALFGASAGAWSNAGHREHVSARPQEAADVEAGESGSNCSAEESRKSDALRLLEHYGALGCAPGAWIGKP